MPDESSPVSPQPANPLLDTIEVSATAIVTEPVESLLAEYANPQDDHSTGQQPSPPRVDETDDVRVADVAAAATTGPKTAAAPPSKPTFDDLPLSDDVKQAVRASGYNTPTAIQSEIIPLMLDRRDVLGTVPDGHRKNGGLCDCQFCRTSIRRPRNRKCWY